MGVSDDQKFFVGQKAFIEKKGKILLLFDPERGLDFPGGKIQINEYNFIESLKREVREETNLEIEVGQPIVAWESEMYGPYMGNRIFLIGYDCKYLSGEFRLSDEHDKFKWVDSKTFKNEDDGSNYFEALRDYFKKKSASF